MKKLTVFLLIVLFTGLCFVQVGAEDEPKIPPMPAAVSNNAVATLQNGLEVFSLMGVGPKKTWDDVSNKVYMLRLASAKWSDIRAVPGVAGRLGAVAVGMRGKIFLFGGYIVDNQGGQIKYQVQDLTATLKKATTAGVKILSAPYTTEDRTTAIVEFPGGYVAETHSVTTR